jgi:predicted nucleic acid-binding protein
MTTFIDTNVVIAMLDTTDAHHQWATAEFAVRQALGPVIISDIVYCEASASMLSRADFDSVIRPFAFDRYTLNDDDLYRAGQAFLQYRRRPQSVKTGVMPDFLIGAAAEVNAAPLMTSNARDFTGYFPAVTLITPPAPAAATLAQVQAAGAPAPAPQPANLLSSSEAQN